MPKQIKLMPDDVAAAMTDATDRLAEQVLQIEAHYHEHGQSHWRGGSRNDDNYEAPSEDVIEAFKALRAAARALATVGHHLTMHRVKMA